MNFHNPAPPWYRPRAHSNPFRQLPGQQAIRRPGDSNVRRAVGRVLLLLCPLVLAINLWLASCAQSLDHSLQAASSVHHDRLERQIGLRAKKEQLSSPERVRLFAADRLSLYVPKEEQIKVF